ncbi:proline dehydrogenase family protein [Staphylococcus aureus]
MGPRLGADKVVAGNTIPELINTIEYLNDKNIAGTVDNFWEFVGSVEESNDPKEQILTIMDALHQHGVKAHMYLEIESVRCRIRLRISLPKFKEILLKANTYNNMHINIDTEKYASLQQIVQVLDSLKGEFRNVGTVIQAYLYDSHKLS